LGDVRASVRACGLGVASLLVFAAAIASIRFATSQRPPFIMFGLGSHAVTLSSAHPLVAASSLSGNPVGTGFVTAQRGATADGHRSIEDVTRLVEGPATRILKGGDDIGAGGAFGVYQSANGAVRE
jgi:hypothetical protein